MTRPSFDARYADQQRERRQSWLQLLEAGRVHGEWVGRGITPTDTSLLDLRHAVTRANGVRFPLPYASAQAAAAGFLHLARGYVESAQAELREALAQALAAAARCCLRMIEIDDEQTAAAASRRRWPGED